MMRSVLWNPPAVAQPGQSAARRYSQASVGSARTEDLLVTRIVADESQLCEHDPQKYGWRDCEPGVADADDGYPPPGVSKQRSDDLEGVIGRSALQEASCPDLCGELAEGELRCVG